MNVDFIVEQAEKGYYLDIGFYNDLSEQGEIITYPGKRSYDFFKIYEDSFGALPLLSKMEPGNSQYRGLFWIEIDSLEHMVVLRKAMAKNGVFVSFLIESFQ